MSLFDQFEKLECLSVNTVSEIMLTYSRVAIRQSPKTCESSFAVRHNSCPVSRLHHCLNAVGVCLTSSVSQLAIQSVRCHSASPVMAVPINVFLCHSTRYRHRYYTALLMALSDGLFTELVTKTDSGLLSVCDCVCVCVFQSQASGIS